MKNILVPIEMHSAIESVLATALLVARRFDSYIEGMPLGPDLPDLVAFDMPVSWTMADQNTWKELADDAHRRFEAFMATQGVPEHMEGGTRLSYGFAGDRSFGDSQVASYARVFDMTVLGRPGADRGDPRMATAEAALFESGRPVILAPPIPPTTLGDTIVIAWNQSMESARATALATPLLMKARKVYILTIEAHNVEGPTAEQLAQMLAAHGVPVEIVHKLGQKRPAGLAYLEDAASLGGDLLIKGAYTQSRLRQMIFGGATAHILSRATMPVLMSN
jgi:nucleotide-binding universal stress UspA family protein